jgi:hypothetical protein
MLVADFSRFLGQPSELFRLLPGRLRCNTVFFGGTTVVLCISTAILSLRPSAFRLLPLLLWKGAIVWHLDSFSLASSERRRIEGSTCFN